MGEVMGIIKCGVGLIGAYNFLKVLTYDNIEETIYNCSVHSSRSFKRRPDILDISYLLTLMA